jgi:hypothetical protein
MKTKLKHGTRLEINLYYWIQKPKKDKHHQKPMKLIVAKS